MKITTILTEDGTIGKVKSNKDVQVGHAVMLVYRDENGNFVNGEGIVLEVLEEDEYNTE